MTKVTVHVRRKKMTKGTARLTGAFLLVILLPVFVLASGMPPLKKYTGPIKPGVVITKDNWDQYLPELEKLLPISKIKWYGMGVKAGVVTMPIVETKVMPLTKAYVAATKKYEGTARIDPVTHDMSNYKAGIPFPHPKNAVQLAWNVYSMIARAQGHEDCRLGSVFMLFNGLEYEKSFSWYLYSRKYCGRTDILPLGDMPQFTEQNIGNKVSIIVRAPNEVKGFIQLRNRFWDLDKADACFSYIPSIRRLRRMTGNDLTDPLMGSDNVPDDNEVSHQKLDPKMTFTVLDHKDMLVPRWYLGPDSKPPYDYKKTGPCFQVEWMIEPNYILEIKINDPNYVYSKRVMHIDACPFEENGTFLLYWGEQYDQKGRLWRANGNCAPSSTKDGFNDMWFWLYMNFQTNHYSAMNNDAACYFEGDFDKLYPLKESEVFTIKGLLKQAR